MVIAATSKIHYPWIAGAMMFLGCGQYPFWRQGTLTWQEMWSGPDYSSSTRSLTLRQGQEHAYHDFLPAWVAAPGGRKETTHFYAFLTLLLCCCFYLLNISYSVSYACSACWLVGVWLAAFIGCWRTMRLSCGALSFFQFLPTQFGQNGVLSCFTSHLLVFLEKRAISGIDFFLEVWCFSLLPLKHNLPGYFFPFGY